jgi:hypothetical protein
MCGAINKHGDLIEFSRTTTSRMFAEPKLALQSSSHTKLANVRETATGETICQASDAFRMPLPTVKENKFLCE